MKKMNVHVLKDFDKMITEIPVSDVMVTNIISVSKDENIKKVTEMMAKQDISSVIATEKGVPIGIISDGDVLYKVFNKGKNPEKVKVNDIMARNLYTVKPTVSIGKASQIMKEKKVSKLPVFHEGKLIGILTKHDLLETFYKIYNQNSRFKWLPVVLMTSITLNAILIVIIISSIMQ